MRKGKILLTITNGLWLIEQSAIGAYIPLVASILKGNNSALVSEQLKPAFYSVSPLGAIAFSSGENHFQNSPVGSTAIITMSGPVMKYDNCGDAGTQSYSEIVKAAIASPNIGSIVLKIDSPGGEVAGTEDFANVIKSSPKPIVAYVDDLMASAAYWFGSQASEIYAGNLTARIGSIGTMLSFADVKPMYEKQGVVFHDIYADASVDKNKDFSNALNKDYTGVKETLNQLNDVFLSAVKLGRGEKLNEKETLTGKVFLATDAIRVGLIDGMKSFDETIARAQELSNANQESKINNNQNPKTKMKVLASNGALVAFLAAAFSGFKADETILADEHFEKISSELESSATLKADLQTAKDAAEKASADLVAANATITGLTTEKETLTAEVARLGKANPGSTNTAKEGTDTVSTSAVDATFSQSDADLAAYKAAVKG